MLTFKDWGDYGSPMAIPPTATMEKQQSGILPVGSVGFQLSKLAGAKLSKAAFRIAPGAAGWALGHSYEYQRSH